MSEKEIEKVINDTMKTMDKQLGDLKKLLDKQVQYCKYSN